VIANKRARSSVETITDTVWAMTTESHGAAAL
jgi:hypothetical protein